MSPAFDLGEQARSFAQELSGLLNTTVCNGVRLNVVLVGPRLAHVAYRLTPNDLDPRRGIPLTLGRRKAAAYLGLSYRLQADDEGRYLAVMSSYAGLFADEGLARNLLHYDYERDKGDGYPEAHLQVAADPPVWAEVGPLGKPFVKAHLPVGGRRYRPTLEDLVEFAVVEGVADARPEWEQAVARSRETFRLRQLRAAVRRDPETARAALAELEASA